MIGLKRILVPCVITWGAIQGVHAQGSALRKAERHYADFAFADAVICYERAFAEGCTDLDAARHLADSYGRLRDLKDSERWYALIVSGPEATAEDLYNYACALRANARYAAADSVMALFAERDSSDRRARSLGNMAERSRWLLVDPLLDGSITHLDLNSDAVDMSPAILGGELVLASSRPWDLGVRRTHAWDGQAFMNLFVARDSTLQLLRGKVNTRYHESNATFSADGREMYFTRNNYLNGNSVAGRDGFNNLMIYRSELVDGRWSEATAFAWNDPDWSTGHPSLSADGLVLYFSSDRPGGQGGVDIWKCQRVAGGEWSEPVVLGSGINTPGDEMFPTTFGNRALFFASDGHEGLGGSDVFLSRVYSDGPAAPENVGAPVNSRADDMSLILLPGGHEGWFSSDREGGAGMADLYRLELDEPFSERVRIRGRVVSTETGASVARIPIRLSRPGGGELSRELTGPDGRFEFVIEPQPVIISGGIPGASDLELPMDEYILTLADPELDLLDVPLSTRIEAPLRISLRDTRSGLPAPGVTVDVCEVGSGSRLFTGITGANGLVDLLLPARQMGDHMRLNIRTTTSSGAVLLNTADVDVTDGLPWNLKYWVDLEHVLDNESRMLRTALFTYLGEDGSGDGSQWSGRVVDSRTGRPVERVTVALLDLMHTELVRTVTDSLGRYVLCSKDVPAYIQALVPGGRPVQPIEVPAFGSDGLSDIRVFGTLDLPVNVKVNDAFSGQPLEGVQVSVRDLRDGSMLYAGTTDNRGVTQGTFKDRDFGSEQNIEVTFEKAGYLPSSTRVDFSVLSFMMQELGGPGGFGLIRESAGQDLAREMKLRPIFFDYNEAYVRNDAMADLDLIAHVLRSHPGLELELRSHTDCRGSDAFNRFLSHRRAESVRTYLIEQGIDGSRLVARGMGETEPVNRCVNDQPCSEEEHQANRRTEFLITGSRNGDLVGAP